MATNEYRDDPAAQLEAAGGQTVLGTPLADRLFLFLGIPGLTVALGLAIPALARWALSWESALPLRPVFRIIGSIDRPWEITVNLAVWLLLAMVMVFTALRESTRVTVTDRELRVEKGDQTRTISRAEVSAAFMDGKQLVVLDRQSCQLVRDIHEASRARIAEAFRRHGYPWKDEDPYAAIYQSWSAGSTDLPAAVNDVLAARETALKNKAHREVRELRSALEKLGYVVRDKGVKQFWRPLVRS